MEHPGSHPDPTLWAPTWIQADIDHGVEPTHSDPSASGSQTSPDPIVDTSGSGTPEPETSIDDQAEAAAAAAADEAAAEGVTDTAGMLVDPVPQPATITNIITAALAVVPSNIFGVGCSLARSNSRAAEIRARHERSVERANRRNGWSLSDEA